MSSQELEPKYSYKFSLNPLDAQTKEDEVTKAEIQAYVNEVLGVKKGPAKGSR